MPNTFWILIAYFVISAIGGALSRRQRNRQGRRQTEPETRPEPSPPRDPMHDASAGRMDDLRPGVAAGPAPKSRPAPRASANRSPEDIAAEIRRVMGLEQRDNELEVLEEVYEAPIQSTPVPPLPVVDVEPSHGGSLHDRMEARDAAGGRSTDLSQRHMGNRISARYDGEREGSLRSKMRSADAARALASGARPKVAARRRAFLPTDDLARVFVTMEVLGKPKALRQDEDF